MERSTSPGLMVAYITRGSDDPLSTALGELLTQRPEQIWDMEDMPNDVNRETVSIHHGYYYNPAIYCLFQDQVLLKTCFNLQQIENLFAWTNLIFVSDLHANINSTFLASLDDGSVVGPAPAQL